jgi:phage-related minor tail protein
MSEEVTNRTQDPLAEKIRELEEAKRILEDVEVKALSAVVLALSEAAESLSRTAKDLDDMRTAEWMTAEQAVKHLGRESVKAFEKIAAREGIPKHYLSGRTPRYNRAVLDRWLLDRRQEVHR